MIAAVKSRLALYGDYKEKDTTTKFTPLLDSALRNYQARMGHKPDGIIRQQTVDALNRPLQHYMHQLLLNMERLRWSACGSDDGLHPGEHPRVPAACI